MYDINGKKIVIVKHSYFESSGIPEMELVKYLSGKAEKITYICHPFSTAVSIPLNSVVTEYGPEGEILSTHKAPLIKGGNLIFFIKDFLFSVWFVLKKRKKQDIYIGVDNLNAFAGLFLRLLVRVGKVVFYVMDFTPVRFGNPLLNRIYQLINKICCYHCDCIWNVSETMIEGRESIGIKKSLSARQITVPLGSAYNEMPRKEFDHIEKHSLVYFGSLRDEHGPGLIIEALPLLIKKYSDIKVIFAGGGELFEPLKNRSEELGVSDYVRFTGFLEKAEDAYEIISRCGLALATYPPGENTYKRFCDPGKVKIYLACGLPVLITRVPAIADEIEAKGAGKIVSHDVDSLTGTIESIFNDETGYSDMRVKSAEMGAEYSWENIWKKTFSEM